MTNRVLQAVKVLLIGLALVTLCVAENVKPATDSDAANTNQHSRILQQAPAPELLIVRAETLNSGAISRDDFDGLERTLTDYQDAFESLSLSGIYKVWPGLDQRREAAFRGVFKFLQGTNSTPRLDLQCTVPVVANLTASVDCREALTYRSKDQKIKTVGPVRVSILLKKESDIWLVEKMRGL
jgi:hypothetical protein